MRQEKEVMKMAGYYTSQALVDVSCGEIFTPLIGYLDWDGTLRMERVSGNAYDETLAEAEQKIDALDVKRTQGAILIKDGLVTLDACTTDCLIMDIRFTTDGGRKVQYLQPYRSNSHFDGFAIYPLKFTEIEGFSANCAHELIQALFDGMESHTEGALLKASHYFDPITEPPLDYFAAAHATDDYGLTSEEFACLQLAPLLIFSIMARVHGRLTPKKYEALGRMLFNAQKTHSTFFEKVAYATINNIESLMAEQMKRPENVLENIHNIRRITDSKLPAEDARSFKKALLLLGYEVAKASDSFLWFRRPLTRKQRKVLQGIADCLELA